jgi:chemotaxis protein methyltransferase CheR
MSAGAELRAVVRFERLNLHAECYHVAGPFDVILCRNVLIYFGEPARTAALQRVANLLAEGGYMLLGHAESPGRALEHFEPVQTMIFRNRPPRPIRSDR